MSASSILIGTWLVANAAFLVAMSLRRDRPVLRDRLFLWVVDGRREAEEGPANPTDSPSIPAVADPS